jgi:hypothetical protein
MARLSIIAFVRSSLIAPLVNSSRGVEGFRIDGAVATCPPFSRVSPFFLADSTVLGFAKLAVTRASVAFDDLGARFDVIIQPFHARTEDAVLF